MQHDTAQLVYLPSSSGIKMPGVCRVRNTLGFIAAVLRTASDNAVGVRVEVVSPMLSLLLPTW